MHRYSTAVRASTGGESGLRVSIDAFKARVQVLATETADSLQSIWSEAGYEETERQSLLGDLLHKLKAVCASELAAEQQILEHAKQEVHVKTVEYTTYCTQLGRKPDGSALSASNYADKLADLERVISAISVEVSQRRKLLDAELKAVNQLCTFIGEDLPGEDAFSGPEGTPELSDICLSLIRERRQELEEEKMSKLSQMKIAARNCKTVLDDLLVEKLESTKFGLSIKNSRFYSYFEAIMKLEAVEVWEGGLTKDDFSTMEQFQNFLEQEKERRRNELGSSGAEIARLWTLLRVPSADREMFQSSFEMNLSEDTLDKGKAELQRLQEIRVTSLAKVVGCIRTDIVTFWDELCLDSEERRKSEFPLFFVVPEELTDDAVELHEEYFLKLKARVEELRPLLQRISRREAIVQERIELEHIQLNSERLTARGPNAREDRKREETMTYRVKSLEKLTKELIASIQQWEEENGPFMYAGERLLERIARQEESYVEIRDSLRNARKKKDGKAELMPPPPRAVGKKPAVSGATATLSGTLSVQRLQQHDKICPPSPVSPCVNNENSAISANALAMAPTTLFSCRDSEITMFTSVTEVRERESCATIVKERL